LILYFDSAYIAKCYLPEPGAEKVRELARTASGLYSSSLSLAELACVFHRQGREKVASAEAIAAGRRFFADDLRNEVWSLIPVSDRLLHRVAVLVQTLPADCLLRAGDAIHLATAIDSGFHEIWTNDRRLLAAAEAAGLGGRSIESPSPGSSPL
jgi:predicted nucleic acid-binding protein